ncbi:glycosyltransferase [Stratiformator vulcanicus]|uniref:N-acetylgalactosamine-N, N'-diacetylbacillosaminyl-diphospho-undecaprenol 4-alpha-N-acetylgalactosaminyltransferase n=1 Tax=Stratiformator vulcanicus TaxID=2527980 RepID=A0A517R0P4_9PLAN|nr:glycosyltransferase [Stratiformator vulcanicus]QDT37467.1 N-acetylgalactosamine-N,N'-diacetylbacillosaminyl-diphospho-undecaprenol 4-alpha-N-acetylgalactosaminyltransferase [Stratiformator vulcanicus]
MSGTIEGQQRVRVMVVSHALTGGGAETQIRAILRHLDRSLFEPFLYLFRGEEKLGELIPDDISVDVFCGPGSSGRRWRRGVSRFTLARDLAATCRRHRIDVLYDRLINTTLQTAPATWLSGIPRVSAYSSNPDADFASRLKPFPRVQRYAARKAYHSAATVTANSECLRRKVIEFFDLPPDRVVNTPNLIDFAQIQASVESADEIDRSDGATHLICVGRLRSEKGQRDLLHALALLRTRGDQRPMRLHLLGNGPDEADLRRIASAEQIDDRVEFHGHVENPFEILGSADLFILPSLDEGSPNALLEAIAAGVPVIATDCPCGPAEILDNGRLGRLVPVGSPVAIADAISDYLDDPQSWRSRTDAARTFVEQRHTPRHAIRVLEEVLLDAANRG